MKNNKLYICSICDTTPDQISHHKMHLETQKHKDKKELFKFRLTTRSKEELIEKYNTDDIDLITESNENVVYDQKKLNNIVNNSKDLIDIEILSKKMAETYVVSNKEALRDKIHEIHNFLRNNGAGYGMNALKVFNILYGLKKIEENKLIDKIKLKRPEGEFSYLLKYVKDNGEEKLSSFIYNEVLDAIKASEIDYLLFYEIPRNMKSSALHYLIREINNITEIEKKCNVLLSGKIYEYFIGRDETAISELGAYFTDRHITEFIFNKVKPSLNADKSVKSMVDMFGGSGGFTTGYIDYLVKKYPKIDWKKEISKIYHYDMNEDVIKSAGLEFFCLTGELPNLQNLSYKNSFKDEFENKKFDYVITNPPYGGDKNKQSDNNIKRNKVKEYIKNELKTLEDKETIKHLTIQLKALELLEKQDKTDADQKRVSVETSSNRIIRFAKNHKLTGNDKESVSLMLMMDMLNVDGVCVGVLKEGVFFNNVYKDLRKCLIENYNVTDVISVPQDQFENTSTKTSIVIFKNTKEKTTKIKFSTLNVEKFENDVFSTVENNIVLLENKGDIKQVVENVVSDVKLEYIREKKYSLNGKDYEGIGEDKFCPDGFELKKFGDLIEYKQKSKRKASEGKDEGKYRFYTSSDKIKYCDFVDNNDDLCLILGTGGVGSLFMDHEFSCSADNFTFTTKLKSLTKYIYYYLKSIWKEFTRKMFNGSTLGHINKENLNNYEIPVPKDITKIDLLIKKLDDTYNQLIILKGEIPNKEKEIQNKIQEICDDEECDEYQLKDVLKRHTNGKSNTTSITNTGEYDFYSATANNPSGTNKKYDFDGKEYFLFAKSGGNSSTIYGENLGIGKFWLVNGKTSGNVAMIKMTNESDITNKYLYYYLKSYLFTIQKMAQYSTGNGNIQMTDLMNKFKIKVPKSKTTMKKLEKEFEEIDTLKEKQKENEKKYKEHLAEFKQLFEEKKEIKQKSNEDSETKDEKSDEDFDSPKDKEEETKKIVKKVVKKVIKKVIKKE